MDMGPDIVEETYKKLGRMSFDEWILDGKKIEIRQIQVLADGHKYVGCWDAVDNVKHGFGIDLSPEGNLYEGYWVGGVPHYQGRIIFAGGKVIEGDFEHGTPVSGRIIQPYGEIYSGKIQDNQPFGEGKLTLPNGNSFSGLFRG